MNFSISIKSCLSLSLLFLVACTNPADEQRKKNKKIREDLDKTLQDILNQNPTVDLQDILSELNKMGGQPGKITVSGVMVQLDGEEKKLDSRFQTKQVLGKNDNLDPAVVTVHIADANKTALKTSEEAQLKAVELADDAKGFYVNLGCKMEELTEEQIGSLQEKVVKAVETEDKLKFLNITAEKVFICGEQSLSDLNSFSVKASHLELIDAKVSYRSLLGYINLQANQLSLVGKNLFGVYATNDLFAPTLNLAVSEEVKGEGELLLESVGADQKAEEKEKPQAQ